MVEQYEPTAAEKQLMIRFTMERTMHTWETKDKVGYLAYLNKRAGLPFGTIGLLHTEYEDWKTKQLIISEVPYASRQTTVELAKREEISLQKTDERVDQDEAQFCYRAIGPSGRFVEAIGVTSLINNKGNPLAATQRANKIMHAETKAKRRATLEFCGLAFIDEAELDTVEGAKVIDLVQEKAEPQVDVAATEAIVSTTPQTETPKGNGAAASTASSTSAQAASRPGRSANGTTPPQNAAIQPTSNPKSEVAPVLPGGKRFEKDAALFAGADTDIVADAAHINWIKNQCVTACGWDVASMSRWLKESFGVVNSNAKETLTLAVFKKIALGIDTALTSAGR